MSAAVAVQARHISRRFETDKDSQSVLESVNVDISAGQRVALLGPSGSGKSTLLNLLAGIDRPDAGEVHLNDFVMSSADDRSRTLYRRVHIGFVFQAFNLVPTLTVRENIELPLVLGHRRRTAIDGRFAERVSAVLDDVAVGHLEKRFPDSLSGGEQQRVAVARAIVHRPGLILADEPTGNLDHDNARRVLELLMALSEDRGATLVLATHSHAAAALTQRVLTVVNRALVERPLAKLNTC